MLELNGVCFSQGEIFTSYPEYDTEFEKFLKRAYEDLLTSPLVDTKQILHNLFKEYARAEIKTVSKTSILRMLFEAGFVQLLSTIPHFRRLYMDLTQFLCKYPSFSKCDSKELKKLLSFRNWMTLALLQIPGKGHKDLLIQLCTRLSEGFTVKYITGGGQRAETRSRVLIFETESGVLPNKRPPRRMSSASGDDDESVSSVGPFSPVSVVKYTAVIPGSDEGSSGKKRGEKRTARVGSDDSDDGDYSSSETKVPEHPIKRGRGRPKGSTKQAAAKKAEEEAIKSVVLSEARMIDEPPLEIDDVQEQSLRQGSTGSVQDCDVFLAPFSSVAKIDTSFPPSWLIADI